MYEEQMEKNKKQSNVDMVNHPPHYTQGYMEVIDMMVGVFGEDSVAMYCWINAFKYRMRAGKKTNLIQDIEKAEWYERKAEELTKIVDEDRFFCDQNNQKGVAVDVNDLEEFGEEFDPSLHPETIMDCYTYVKNNSIPL